MLKQQLQQKLQQKLSPQQIQIIKMLEYPTMELEERIRQELEENPTLEEGRDETEDNIDDTNENAIDEEESQTDNILDIDEYINDDDIPDYKLRTNNYSQDTKQENIPFSARGTFREHLLAQLGEQQIDESIRKLAEYIIGNVDSDGYLRRDIEQMVDDIAFQTGISVSDSQMEKALHIVQSFDPAGVAARNLKECLLLQLKSKNQSASTKTAIEILETMFEEFSQKHYESIARKLHLDRNDMRKATNEITRLNPKPGSAWSNGAVNANEHIIPDFTIEHNNGKLTVVLNNQNIPDLHISHTYSNMIQDYMSNKNNQSTEMKNAVVFAKQKIDAARWFIDAIKQRSVTLLVTMDAILNFQKPFFLCGDETQLRPMILKDIADITGFDISTISRVSNSKYVQTEFGIFPLRYFFSETIKTEDGEDVSNKKVKRILQECVNTEDKRHPVSDDQLTAILHEKGFPIARRTVAKYREQMGIPVARLRKQI